MLTNQFKPKSYLKSLSLLLLATGLLSGCDKEDAGEVPQNENELITSLTLTLQEAGTSTTITASFRDPNGEGGAPPILFDQIILKPNKVYNTIITLQDESKTPAKDLTAEIAEEADDHQFFFTPTTGLNIAVAYDDKDRNNLPLGLKTIITTGAASSGKLKVTLKHQAGTKNNNIATGETDVELDFTAKVQ